MFRTHLPGFPPGLCVPRTSLTPCSSSCSCCGQHCCPPHYHAQWADVSCVSHHQCRSWATGQYCCQDNRCCDTLQDYDTDYLYDDQYYTTESYYQDQTDYNYSQYYYQDTDYTTTESVGNETFSVYENYEDNDDSVENENTTVEIVAIDHSDDDEESVKVTTFYETVRKNSTEEQPNHDKKLSEEAEEIVAMLDVESVNIIDYSGSGEVTEEEESSEEVMEADLSGEVQIDVSLEVDERELSTVWSSFETSSQSEIVPEDLVDDNSEEGCGSGSDFIEFHLEISGSGQELEQETDDNMEEGDTLIVSNDELEDSNSSIIIGNILTGVESAPQDVIELNVPIVNLTQDLEKSTKEVAWKSDATVRNACFSVVILCMTILVTL